MHTSDTSQANDNRDKAHPAGNQEFRDNNYPKKKIPQKRITRKSDQSSQKMHARNAKQYKQIKRRMVKKLNQQEVELEQKDQDVVRFVTEVERLQRTIRACTLELRETQIKVKKHFRDNIRAILKTDQMLEAENIALKDLVSGLSDLRKENEQQKGRILELAYLYMNWGNIVTMLKEVEARNESKTEGFRLRNPQLRDTSVISECFLLRDLKQRAIADHQRALWDHTTNTPNS